MHLIRSEIIKRSRARNPERTKELAKIHRKAAAMHARELKLKRSFVGVDGEGAGKDLLGRQDYRLLRAGDQFIMNDGHLRTEELLNFIAGLDPDPIYVGYYFNYDVTMILRDVPHDMGLLSRFGTHWKGFNIYYMPNKEFWVCRSEWDSAANHYKAVSPRVTINDVGPFFQCPFYKALADWKIGDPEQLAEIAAGKALRPEFETITAQIFSYNRLEVELLAQLMEQFRDVCEHCDIVPDKWQGPGWVAAKMLQQNGIAKTKELTEVIDRRLWDFANKAYYGGRFEITRVGHIASTVHEYDICSAYPAGMIDLPCLQHGEWSFVTELPTEPLYIAEVHFRYPEESFLCDFPIRDKRSGTIYWPNEGIGWYHSIEIDAAVERDEIDFVRFRGAWQYHRQCDCKPFGEFVPRIYAERKAIGKSTKGYPLKLGLNSLYGKLCQSIGSAPFANPIWGGMITAHCRAQLIRAYSKLIDIEDVVMLATDGLYTLSEMQLDIGEQLGEWERKRHPGMFLLKPGVYYYDTKDQAPKTRGIARSVLQRHEQMIRSTFAEWLEHHPKGAPKDLFGRAVLRGFAPEVKVEVVNFIGRRLAIARHRPETAGSWVITTRTEKMDWSSKRDGGILAPDGKSIKTIAKRGSPRLTTHPYQKQIGKVGTFTQAEFLRYDSRLMREEQPDWIGELNG